MIRFTCTLVIFLSLFAHLQGQWEIWNEGVKGSINTIDFVNETIGWIAGTEGLLLKTRDGGESWHPIPLDKNWFIHNIDFVNDSVGWAIGTNCSDFTERLAIILKTVDGGRTWLVQKSWRGDYWRPSELLHVVNDDVVYAVGFQHNQFSRRDDTKVFKTADGGENWMDITPRNSGKYPQSIWFFNDQVGLITGSFSPSETTRNAFVWSTHDGGLTWDETIIPELSGINDLQFVDDSTGYFLADRQSDSSSFTVLGKTTDGLRSWSIITQIDWSNWINSFFYLGSGHFCTNIGPGFSFLGRPSINYISKSVDGGMTWEQKLPAGPWNLNKMYFINDQVGFSIGGGTLMRSIDGGENWCAQKFSYSFEDVYFIDRKKGFAGGGWLYLHRMGSGDMFMTDDGGKTWQPNLSTGEKIESCIFVNPSLGFAICRVIEDGSWLLKTVDGGENWARIYIQPDMTDIYFEGKDILFINEQTGWAVGWGPSIIGTMDGGENWHLVWNKNIEEGRNYLNSIYFVNDSTGWAVGDNGLIVQYRNLGGWLEKPKITDLPLNKVYFIDENTGYFAGGYVNYEDFNAKLFKTKNGGESWDEILEVPYLINDIYFKDSLHGWAVGSDKSEAGVILATKNGGAKWTVEIDGLIGPLRALDSRDDFLWAVGDYGLVLRLDLITTIEDGHNPYLPLAFKLDQNYPNPFNSVTSIQYQVSRASEVELSIYNILGQKVAALVSEKQPAGSYKVEWDAVDFASGVYLSRLVIDKVFMQTKKLVLLR